MNRLVSAHTYEGGNRVVLIRQADKMNPQAQNALLKTIEEPPEGTVFLLTTDSPERMLTTIISRCRSVKLHPWPDAVICKVLSDRGVSSQRQLETLHLCGGSIGKAIAMAEDEAWWQRRQEVMKDFLDLPDRSAILTVSTKWKDKKEEADALLSDVEDMLRTLMLVGLGNLDAQVVSAYPQSWQKMAAAGSLKQFLAALEAVQQARLQKMNNVTWQAVVERLLLRLMEENNPWRK